MTIRIRPRTKRQCAKMQAALDRPDEIVGCGDQISSVNSSVDPLVAALQAEGLITIEDEVPQSVFLGCVWHENKQDA